LIRHWDGLETIRCVELPSDYLRYDSRLARKFHRGVYKKIRIARPGVTQRQIPSIRFAAF
jgi:hypothetical protein